MQGPQRFAVATGRDKWLGHGAALLFSALIAVSFSIGHLAAPHIGAAALSAVRFALAFAVMAGILAVTRGWRLSPPRAPWRFGVLGALMGAYFVTMFLALKITSPVSTGAVFTLIPLMSAGFGYVFLGHRPGLRRARKPAGRGSGRLVGHLPRGSFRVRRIRNRAGRDDLLLWMCGARRLYAAGTPVQQRGAGTRIHRLDDRSLDAHRRALRDPGTCRHAFPAACRRLSGWRYSISRFSRRPARSSCSSLLRCACQPPR